MQISVHNGVLRSQLRLASTLSHSRSRVLGSRRIGVQRASTRNAQSFKAANRTPHTITGYYITFPVIPDETPENNVFLESIAKNADWPPLKTATPEEIYDGTARMLMEYGASVFERNEQLEKDKDAEKTFDAVMEPLVVEEHDVDYAFSTLMLKMLTDWPVHDRSAAQYDLVQIDKLYARINLEKYQSKGIRDALKSIYESGGEGLNRWQMRFIELYLLEIRATGLDKDEEKTRDLIASWNRFVQEYRIKYLSNIMLTSGNHVFNIPSPSSLKDAPPQALLDLAAPSTANSSSSSQQASSKSSSTKTNKIEQNDFERGIVKMDNNDLLAGSAWRATMRASSIYNVLTYCSDRSVRAAAWDRFISRASFEHDWHNNSINIEEIRHNNEGLAKTLGYASTSEHRMANKMAGSPETVRNFLNALTQRVRPVFMDRMESWESYAAAKESITGGLQPFDLFYVSRREAEAHYE
ncbi:Peptidase M3A/M3B [Aphelenchoides avenae]|nr:Peptidase M3A/M3B [Aphelenchus avenae]